jgi:hypothetical protein
MTTPRSDWDIQELELFHDEELDAECVAALSDDLRHDAALRARLASVRGLDERIRWALLQPSSQPAKARAGFRPRIAAVAATVAAAAGASLWLWPVGPGPTETTADHSPQAAPYNAVRIVFATPVAGPIGERQPTEEGRKPGPTARLDGRGTLERMDDALSEGRVEEALELMASVDAGARRAAYRHLGDVLRSAQVAESLLARLEPAEQLEVCSVWAAEPSLRPVVFGRLRQLSSDPSVANELQSLVVALSQRPGLRSWLRGYDLTRPS